ncbi:MAG: hypothetical protein JNM43_18755 [Planctomycetaceae bacterium]|nr:hypothetical protein [Planctomycetaceae bacterium]
MQFQFGGNGVQNIQGLRRQLNCTRDKHIQSQKSGAQAKLRMSWHFLDLRQLTIFANQNTLA